MVVVYVCDQASAGPEGISKLREVAQMPMVSITCYYGICCHVWTYNLMGCVPYDQLTEKEKTRSYFTHGSMCYAGTTQK